MLFDVWKSNYFPIKICRGDKYRVPNWRSRLNCGLYGRRGVWIHHNSYVIHIKNFICLMPQQYYGTHLMPNQPLPHWAVPRECYMNDGTVSSMGSICESLIMAPAGRSVAVQVKSMAVSQIFQVLFDSISRLKEAFFSQPGSLHHVSFTILH